MPNNSGPHNATNRKNYWMPTNVAKDKIIGHTGNLNGFVRGRCQKADPNALPTVYFTVGHFTQAHHEDWNLGWENYEGWQCRFFGNIHKNKLQDVHFHKVDPQTKKTILVTPDQHFQDLTDNGVNRFQGGRAEDIRSWRLQLLRDENDNYKLREFWIMEGKTGDKENERFPHRSRNFFMPVTAATKDTLWKQVEPYVQSSHQSGARPGPSSPKSPRAGPSSSKRPGS